MHSLNTSSSCDSFFGQTINWAKRERYEHGQDRKEESEAGTQGEGEDCCEALGQRPPQDDREASDRSQVEGSSPEGRLTADVTIDVHDRPGDLSGPRPIHFWNRPIVQCAEMRADIASREKARATPDCAKQRFHQAISPRTSRRIVHSKMQNRSVTA